MLKGRVLVLLVAALLGAGLTARLGLWQLDRAAQKTHLQAELQARRLLPALPLAGLPADAAAAQALQHRRVQLDGHWLPEHTVYLDNRPMAGRVGFLALTPLRLADGSVLLVQRGWLPRDAADRTRIVAAAAPAGPVRVEGRIALETSRLYELAAAESGTIRQNLPLASFTAESGLPLRPWVVVQEGDASPPDGLLRLWPEPTADVHKHYGYAFQWFALCALIIGLYAWFQLIRPRRATRS